MLHLMVSISGPPNAEISLFSELRGKGYSPKSTYTLLYGMLLWERRMAYFHALKLIAKHKIWEQ